jgi:TPR repeat protein
MTRLQKFLALEARYKAPLLVLIPAGPAIAGMEEGYDAFERGDVEAAVAIWLELAEQGNATAQFNLGQLYRLGQGVPIDDQQALKWYLLAAEGQGDGQA